MEMLFRLQIKGRVQGVGCRYYCRENARLMKMHGSASNLYDGSVEVLIDATDRKHAEEYAENLRTNRFDIGFFGKIISIGIEEYYGQVKGDYLW